MIELMGASPDGEFVDGKIVYCGYRRIEFVKKTKDPYPSTALYPSETLYPADLLVATGGT